MKRKKTSSPQRSDIAEIVRRVQDYRPAKGDFNYAERGRAVTEAHQLYNESFQLGKIYPMAPNLAEANTKAHRLWFEALRNAYPHGFWGDIEKLRAGDAAGLESALGFLEADPFFFSTGYTKVRLVRCIKPPMLTPRDKVRLQNVVLHIVETRSGTDFGAFCRLAKKVDAPGLREQLTRRLDGEDADIRRRARWVLDALAQKDRMEQGRKDAAARKQRRAAKPEDATE